MLSRDREVVVIVFLLSILMIFVFELYQFMLTDLKVQIDNYAYTEAIDRGYSVYVDGSPATDIEIEVLKRGDFNGRLIIYDDIKSVYVER